MSISMTPIFGSQVLVATKSASSPKPASGETKSIPIGTGWGGGSGGLMIECSSRPKKKATAHHMKTRPKKSQPWDIRRKPTVYPPLPPLPPEWTLVSSSPDDDDGATPDLPSSPATEAPVTSG
uniref:Uncharacterized protein n=1 Tax=Rhizophora mucronata TaxID=61149 RepID=A0A2P2IWL3_RHIMU